MTSPPSRTSRCKRPNYWLGKIIPALLVVFGYSGYRLVLLDVYPLVKAHSPVLARLYISWVNTFLALVILCYSLVYFRRITTSEAEEVPSEVKEKRVLFACDDQGNPLRCFQDACNGSYLSIRTRHCRDCGTCRRGFDHHCSFMDNCVSTSTTFKPFVNFIFYAVLLLVVALVPLAPLQYRAFSEVIETTWETQEMKRAWWDRWYSWAGGPVWRYAGAIVLGYFQYPSVSIDRPFLVSGHRVKTFVRKGVTYEYDESLYPNLATPTLSTLAIVSFASLIVGIGIAMLLVIVINSRKGMSAVQVERSRRYRQQKRNLPSSTSTTTYDPRLRLWIPLNDNLDAREGQEKGAIMMVEPDAPLYDFGGMRNWKNLMGENWWEWFIPTRIPPIDDTVINPSILKHLRLEARKGL